MTPKDEELKWSNVSIGLNRENFVQDILNNKFGGSFRVCAEAMGMKPNYLRDIIMNPGRGAGTRVLTCIYRYCKTNGINPEPYIFVTED